MQTGSFSKISFYIVAHADDWQLFMQPNAYNDLVSESSKVVFIITTAGDAGADKNFWQSREEGMKSSVRFCLAPIKNLSYLNITKEFNQHKICCWKADNVACYFLRLPDGNLDGSGFSRYYHESLSKLKAAQIPAITAVDNSSTYSNWDDFCTTLQTIIHFESEGTQDVHLNFLNPDNSINPNDHNDHIATGEAVKSIDTIAGLKQSLFVGYSVGEQKQKLSAEELFWKAGMFAAYEKSVWDHSSYSTLNEGVEIYKKWCLSSASFVTINH